MIPLKNNNAAPCSDCHYVVKCRNLEHLVDSIIPILAPGQLSFIDEMQEAFEAPPLEPNGQAFPLPNADAQNCY